MKGFGLTTYPLKEKQGNERQLIRIYLDGNHKVNIILIKEGDEIDVRVYRNSEEDDTSCHAQDADTSM